MITKWKRWMVFAAILLFCLAVFPGFAGAQKILKVGCVGPFKFSAAENGWRAAVIAAEEINGAGGIQVKGEKYKIELVKVDDNSFLSVPDAVSGMEKIITVSGCKFVLGGYRSESTVAAEEVIADHKAILLSPFSGAPERVKLVAKNYDRYKYFFSVLPPNTDISQKTFISTTVPIIRALMDLGIKKPKVYIIAEKALWVEPIVREAQKIFPAIGCELVGEFRPSWSAKDLTAELSTVKGTGTHFIFHVSAGQVGNVIARQWGELKIPAALGGINGNAQQGDHWQATNGMCNYNATADWLGPVKMTERTIPFYDKFVEKHKEGLQAPGLTAAGNYDGLYILKGAIERAGSLDVDAVVAEIEKTDYKGAAGRYVFQPKGSEYPHDVTWGPGYITGVGIQWVDGKNVVYFPDGRDVFPAFNFPSDWKTVRYEGTQDYKLPPWVVEHWKGKK